MPYQRKPRQRAKRKPNRSRAVRVKKYGYTFRSKLEALVADQLSLLDHKEWDWTYETSKIPYEHSVVGKCLDCDSSNIVEQHIYIPDFDVHRNGQLAFRIEAKGKFPSETRTKHKHIKSSNPELDLRFVFYANSPLTKAKKKRNLDWCEDNNILGAVRNLPDDWFL